MPSVHNVYPDYSYPEEAQETIVAAEDHAESGELIMLIHRPDIQSTR